MDIEQANYLIRTLSETRSTEVKTWFDPTLPEGKAKLVKGLHALRNFDGGSLVIGFDDETLLPDIDTAPADVVRTFHADAVQETVSHYSSDPFDVELHYPELDGRTYVVIAVPSGILSPVAVTRDLFGKNEKRLLTCNDIYFRTLQSNNRVSSSKVTHKDLPDLIRVCFDNREADIGAFIRRHLSGLTSEHIAVLSEALLPSREPRPSLDDQLEALLDDGEKRYAARVAQRNLTLPPHGSMEVALVLTGTVPPTAPTLTS